MNEFNTIPDNEIQRRASGRIPPWRARIDRFEPSGLPDGTAEIPWLRVSFSTHFDAAGVERWHERLHDFLSGCDLTASISLERIAIFPVGKAITSFDRGLVIGWLMAQPEVVSARTDRRVSGESLTRAQSRKLHGS
jgi:hypothetical protein